jgi:hypothetical protein
MRIAALPPPGITSDDTKYAAPGTWEDGNNVRFFHGKPESIGNQTDLQSASLETYGGTRALMAYKISTDVMLAVGGESTLYSVDTSDWTRTDITPAAGFAGSGDGFSLAMFGDILLASPENKTIYTSTAGAQAVEIANAPDQITRMVVTPSRQVMALGCNEEVSGTFNGRCIRWCDIEDYTDWTTSSSNNAGEYILPGQDNIVGGCNLGDYIVIWTKASLWLGQYIGQPGQTYIFTRIASVGIASQHAFAIYGGALYWMDPAFNFHVYQPGGLPVPIPCPLQIQRSALTTSNEDRAFTRRRFGEIWFFYVPTGGSAPTAYIAYSVLESQAAGRPIWFKGTMSAAAVVDDPLLESGLNMGDSTAIRIAGGSTEKLIAFDRQDGGGTTASWSITTSFYYVDEGERRSMITRYHHDVERQDANLTITVYAKDRPVGSEAQEILTVTSSNTRKDFRLSGKMIRYQIAGTDLWRIGKPVFDAVTLGTR